MVRQGRAAATAAACAVAAVAACVCAWVGHGGARPAALLSRRYWSAYYAGAPAYPRYGSAQYTGYPSYAAMPLGRRPSYYNSDVNVEEAIGLPTSIDDLNFKTKEGKEAVERLRDVIAAVAFNKKIDKVEDEDRDRVDVTDITSIPAVVTVSEIYPKKRPEGVRVDFIVKAPDAHAADGVIALLTESKLTQGLRQAKILPGADKKKKIKAGRASILSVTTSAFATPMYDDNQAWGQENATQNAAYQAYLRSFYGSAKADNSRWPWLDNHMIFNELGGNNGYEFSAADEAIDNGDAAQHGINREVAFDDLSGDLDDTDFYGSGGGLRHGDMRSALLGDDDAQGAGDAAATDSRR